MRWIKSLNHNFELTGMIACSTIASVELAVNTGCEVHKLLRKDAGPLV
jgi:hypothetical protein